MLTSMCTCVLQYDYLIVFPITEGQWQIPKLEKTDRISDRVIWQEVKRAWHEGCPGTEEDKEEAIENLATFWKKRCGLYPEDDDELLRVAWLTVAREAIIDTLMKKSGLQLKLSAIPGSISCRLRAPLKLLELQADKENYRLQFRSPQLSIRIHLLTTHPLTPRNNYRSLSMQG